MAKIQNWSKHGGTSWRHDSLPLELRVVEFGGVESPTGKVINQRYKVRLIDYSGVRATEVNNSPLVGSSSNKQEVMSKARNWMKKNPMPSRFVEDRTSGFEVGERAV